MRFQLEIPHPFEEVWRCLRDIRLVAGCMPAATVELAAGDRVHGRIPVRFKGASVTYRGTLGLAETGPGTVLIEANGAQVRGGGTVEAVVRVHAEPVGESTLIRITGRGGVSGRAAELSPDALEETARRLVDAAVRGFADELSAASSAMAREPAARIAPAPLAVAADMAADMADTTERQASDDAVPPQEPPLHAEPAQSAPDEETAPDGEVVLTGESEGRPDVGEGPARAAPPLVAEGDGPPAVVLIRDPGALAHPDDWRPTRRRKTRRRTAWLAAALVLVVVARAVRGRGPVAD